MSDRAQPGSARTRALAPSPARVRYNEWCTAGQGTGELPAISVIVPARDAEATLPATLESILAQDYGGTVEVIVADGSEAPATAALVRRRFPEVRIVPNPERRIATGLNRALAAARHGVIARCDAHSTLPPGYLARAVRTLLRTGAVNVGGRVRPVGSTPFGRAVAHVTSTPLGAGDARYRIGGAEGPVDTVFPGVFRRDALEAAGGWDETLAANEDYALNWRLRECGGTVWFDPALVADYRPRGDVRALAQQYFRYGRWKAAMLARHPRSLRARQLAPLLLVAGLAASGALAAAAGLAPPPRSEALALSAAAVPVVYVMALLGASVAIGLRNRCGEALLVPAVAAVVHLAWGTGFLAGLVAGLARAAAAPRRRAVMTRRPREPARPGGFEPGGGGLTLRTLSGFKWAFLTSGGQALLSLAIAMTLARLLTPGDFGLLAIALVFLVLADTVGQRGLGPALVQRGELTGRHVATAFTLGLATALASAGALWILAPALCGLIGEAEAAPLLRTLCLATALAGAGLVSEHLLRRRLRFRALMAAAILSQAVGNGLVAVGLALLDWGVWALVWGAVARQAVFTLAVIAFEPVRPRLLAGRRETADLLRTGAGFSATAVFGFLANRGLTVVIANTLGAAALGLFTRALALGVVSARLGPVLADVLLPAMARRQHRAERLRAVHGAGIEMLALAALPASPMLALCAPEIVAVVLGARWEGAVPALRILALAGAVQALGALHVPVIRAMGAVYRESWRRAVFFVLLTAGAWFASRWGLPGVAIAVAAAWIALQVLLAQLALGLLGTGWTALLRRLVPALWTGFWSTAALWLAGGEIRAASLPPLAALALELAVWVAAAAAATWFAPRFARPAFPHWALAQLPSDGMGPAGPRLRAGLACLARRWPAPPAHGPAQGPVPDPRAKAGIARPPTLRGRGP